MKMSNQSYVAARKASKLLGTIKRGIQNKENKIKPLCKFLRNLQVENSGPPLTKTKQTCKKMQCRVAQGARIMDQTQNK